MTGLVAGAQGLGPELQNAGGIPEQPVLALPIAFNAAVVRQARGIRILPGADHPVAGLDLLQDVDRQRNEDGDLEECEPG